MEKTLTLFVVIVLATNNLLAQNLEGVLQNNSQENNASFNLPTDIKFKLDNFFELIIKKEYKNALENLLQNSPISKKDEDYKNILKQISKSIELYGEIKGYEIVNLKIAGTCYYKIFIIGLHQKYPTRWEINFYRSPELGLIVTNFKFDDISEIYLD